MTESTSISREFGSNFEEKILQVILSDLHFGEQIIEILSPDLFDIDYLQDLAGIIKNYYFKYNEFPTTNLLMSICKQEIKDSIKQELCKKYLQKICCESLNGDSKYVKENSLKYFKTQYLKNTLLNDVIPRIQTANFDDIVPIMEKAMQKGTDKNIGYEYKNDEKLRFINEVIQVVPTPWELVNEYLNGGWGCKRLATIIGAAGTGKSHFLVNVGKGALLAGKVVVHYTFELDEIEVARRYDASLTGIEINHITTNKEKVLFLLKKKLPESAKLIIKEYSIKGATIQTIRAHIARLRLKNIVPDIIIIDYGDLIKSTEIYKESRYSLEAIWKEMKSLAQEMKIPVVTATQTNRTGFKSDIITPDQVSEDFSKIMTSDIIITMARNMEQKMAGVGKMLLAKNRQGEDGQIFCYSIETKKAYIECFPFVESDDFENEVKNKFDDENSIKQKLDRFLKEKRKSI